MDLRDQLQRALGAAYRIKRELGQGGMSTVFLAEDLKHQRKVAVKALRPELAAALGPDRFTREIRIAARLQHPHILPLLDSGESQGLLWYVMPYPLALPKGAPVSARLARPVSTGNQIIESFDVSSDGQWLAFDTDRNGAADIYRRPLAGGEEERLTTDPADDFQPQYSRDGREIGFHTFRGGTRDVFVMPAAGGEARPVIATPAHERDAGWSPDGKKVGRSDHGAAGSRVILSDSEGTSNA
jgi:hypothetical protein